MLISCLAHYSTLKMEVIYFFEITACCYCTIWQYSQEELFNFNSFISCTIVIANGQFGSLKTKLRERTIPTERPPLEDRGWHVVSVTDPYGRILDFLVRSSNFFFQLAHLYLWDWVNPFPDPLFLRKSDSAGKRICSQERWPLDHRGGLSSDLRI
jgi:hypothetical protein